MKKILFVFVSVLILSFMLSACGVPGSAGDDTKATATPQPTAQSTPSDLAIQVPTTMTMGWTTSWYQSPFRNTTKQLSDTLTQETFAEPGVYPGMENSQTAWQYMEEVEGTYMLIPEGGYTYQSSGGYCVDYVHPEKSDQQGKEVRENIYCLPKGDHVIYLTVYRGFPADGTTPMDFNQRVFVYDYVVSAGIYHELPAGAYVSLDWMNQQIDNATNKLSPFRDPNCGAEGCIHVYEVIVDLITKSVRIWEVTIPGTWTRVTNLTDIQ